METTAGKSCTVLVAVGLIGSLLSACAPGHLEPLVTSRRDGPASSEDDDPPPTLRLMDGGRGIPDPGPDPGPGQPDAGPAMEEPPPPPPPPPPPMASPYPTGPYGTRRGSTLGDLSFTGIDSAEVTMGELRGDLSVKVIVWISSVEWCGSCRDAVPDLNSLNNRYGSQGLVMIESLYQDYDYNPATVSVARRWEDDLSPNYPTVVEPSPPYADHANPAIWVIDAETMEVLEYSEGLDYSLDSWIESAISRSTR